MIPKANSERPVVVLKGGNDETYQKLYHSTEFFLMFRPYDAVGYPDVSGQPTGPVCSDR
jgi:hypothetical protein